MKPLGLYVLVRQLHYSHLTTCSAKKASNNIEFLFGASLAPNKISILLLVFVAEYAGFGLTCCMS